MKASHARHGPRYKPLHERVHIDAAVVADASHQNRAGLGRHRRVNLPAIGWVNARWARIDRPGPGGTGASTTAIRPAGPALALVLVALGTMAIGVLLAWANPGGCRRLLEDLVYVLVPAGGALAVMMTVSRGDPASRAIRRPLALSLGLCALGQLAAAIADVLPVEFTSVFRAACVGLAASGLVVAVAVLRRSVYTRLEGATRLESFLAARRRAGCGTRRPSSSSLLARPS